MYERVVPRDLFNESKLLKCLGRLALLIHKGLEPIPDGLSFENSGGAFKIDQNLCGSLYVVSGIVFKCHGVVLDFHSAYNNQSNYPLFLVAEDEGEIEVFDDSGEFTEEFFLYIHRFPDRGNHEE